MGDPKLPPQVVEIDGHRLVFHLLVQLFQNGNAYCFISYFEDALQLPIFCNHASGAHHRA